MPVRVLCRVLLRLSAVLCAWCSCVRVSLRCHCVPAGCTPAGDGKDAGAAAPETIDLGDVGDTAAAVGGDVRPRPPECPRLVSIEQGGAVFEFPADCLQKERFRLLMPRACIHCGARTHLSAHVLLWSSQLRDSASMETEHQAGKLVLDEKTTAKLKGADLLARLPEVPNVPPPANRPMPYFVCDLCSAAEWISGQIQINADTGQGICRLHMRNLPLAREFFLNAGGKDTDDDHRFQEFLERIQENRWEALPTAVRHRVEQWFRLQAGGRFIAYVPDRAFGRGEDGMNGLVISDARLIYHRPPLHYEIPNGTQVNVQVRLNGGKEVVTLESSDYKRRSITLDRGGMMLLRRGLSLAKFSAAWV